MSRDVVHGSNGPVRGRRLREGDVIGIVAPAGPVDPTALEQGVALLHGWGFRTKLGRSVLARHGYLAGTDSERAADLNTLWADPEVAGIICARGGYGVMRILDLLDWQIIQAHPKFFCGFSDITALHMAIGKRTGLITFHGPMVAAFGGSVEYNGARLRTAMAATAPLGAVPWPEAGQALLRPFTLRSGVAAGVLTGGNLMLLCALLGTPYEPDLSGRIILLEEVGEAPYAADRMLTQLLLAGQLQRAAGILFGDSPSCMSAPDGKPSMTLLEVLTDRLAPLGIPVLYGFPCGHGEYRATLPLGVEAVLDADAGTLHLQQAALMDSL